MTGRTWTAPYLGVAHRYRGGAWATVVAWPDFTEAIARDPQGRLVAEAIFYASAHPDHTAAAQAWAERHLPGRPGTA